MAASKWSASEVASLLSAWREALETPKQQRGSSVRAHMFELFTEHRGAAEPRALMSVSFKLAAIRNMTDVICAYHARTEEKKKEKKKKNAFADTSKKHPKERSVDDAELLPWFSLSVAKRRQWFTEHNERSYAFLDIDVDTFREVNRLNEPAQRAESEDGKRGEQNGGKRKCYRRVLLKRGGSGEWEAVHERNVGSWAAAVELAAKVSKMDSLAKSTTPPSSSPESIDAPGASAEDVEQSSGECPPDQMTMEPTSLSATTVADDAVATGVAAAENIYAEQSSEETQDEEAPTSSENLHHHHNQAGDDDSATESESDLGAWEEGDDDDDDDEDSGGNSSSNSQDALPQPQLDEGETHTVPAEETIAPSQVVVDSEKDQVVAALPSAQSYPTAVQAEPIASHVDKDTTKEPLKVLEAKQASPVVPPTSTGYIFLEFSELPQAVENSRESVREVPEQHVEKPNVLKIAEATNARRRVEVVCDQGPAHKEPHVPNSELPNIVNTLERHTQLLKGLQSEANVDRKRNQSTENRHLQRLRKLDQGVLGLQVELKAVRDNHRQNRLIDASRNRLLTGQIQDIQTEGRDERVVLKNEIAELQATWANRDAERRREVEALRLECAKLQNEARERDELLASLKQDLMEVRSWMKQAASREATQKSASTQDLVPSANAAGANTPGTIPAASSEATQKPTSAQVQTSPATAAAVTTAGSVTGTSSEATSKSAKQAAPPATAGLSTSATTSATSSDAAQKLAPAQDQAAGAVSSTPATSAARSESTQRLVAVQDRVAADSSSDLSVNKHRGAKIKSPVASDPERPRKRKRTLLEEVKVLHDKLQAKKALAKKTLPSSEPKNSKPTVTEKPPRSDNKKRRIRPVKQPQKPTRARSSIENQDTNRVTVPQLLAKPHAVKSNSQAKKQQKHSAKAPDAPAQPPTASGAANRAAKSKISGKQKVVEPEQEEPPVPPTYRTRVTRSRMKEHVA